MANYGWWEGLAWIWWRHQHDAGKHFEGTIKEKLLEVMGDMIYDCGRVRFGIVEPQPAPTPSRRQKEISRLTKELRSLRHLWKGAHPEEKPGASRASKIKACITPTCRNAAEEEKEERAVKKVLFRTVSRGSSSSRVRMGSWMYRSKSLKSTWRTPIQTNNMGANAWHCRFS